MMRKIKPKNHTTITAKSEQKRKENEIKNVKPRFYYLDIRDFGLGYGLAMTTPHPPVAK